MEVHNRVNQVVAKKLWNVLRVTFFMIRKGLLSKRKLMMDMNLIIKRGKLLRKYLCNLMPSSHMTRGSFGIQEYEFSCSNSPATNPVFFHVPKRKHHCFLCINTPQVMEKEEEEEEEEKEEKSSPLLSPFHVRVSNYSSEDENDIGGNVQVDDQAEDFIRRFYEQLRVQSRLQLLQSQEMEYKEMLARGTT
ncbi:DUF761 domain-containing protein [Cephalotus follicularis]|uniref:DUF761 domain-containing protein n=1 Tax=Cephalotus follicularis TaxID=3775 RepID=A0A1Q3CVC6_CEPFO|nr:DUF761 domain-containing protein [Cephalotus follicularis]